VSSWLHFLHMTPLLIAQIGLTLFVFFMLLNSAAVMVYVERKVAAMLQQRLGPYLVGPKGLLQPLADIIKLLFKEELRPRAADPFLFALARTWDRVLEVAHLRILSNAMAFVLRRPSVGRQVRPTTQATSEMLVQ